MVLWLVYKFLLGKEFTARFAEHPIDKEVQGKV